MSPKPRALENRAAFHSRGWWQTGPEQPGGGSRSCPHLAWGPARGRHHGPAPAAPAPARIPARTPTWAGCVRLTTAQTRGLWWGPKGPEEGPAASRQRPKEAGQRTEAREGRAGGSDAPAWPLCPPSCLPSRRTLSQEVLHCASHVHLPAGAPSAQGAGPPPPTLPRGPGPRVREAPGYGRGRGPPTRASRPVLCAPSVSERVAWGSGDGAAHPPASCPDLPGCLPRQRRRVGTSCLTPTARQEWAPPRGRGFPRSCPLGVLLALRDAGKTECGPDPRPGWLQGLRPSQSPRPCLLPPPSTPDPVSAFPPRRWGWGWSYSVTWVMGRSRPCLGKGPQHPTAGQQASTSQGPPATCESF